MPVWPCIPPPALQAASLPRQGMFRFCLSQLSSIASYHRRKASVSCPNKLASVPRSFPFLPSTGNWCVRALKDVLRELAQLVADHILRYRDRGVHLAVVDLKVHADEAGEDGGGAGLGADGRGVFAGLGLDEWETGLAVS